MNDHRKRVLEEGENCWRKARAGRVSFLVDGAAYFEAFADAVSRAQKSVYIAAWDIDSRLQLLRRENGNRSLPPLGRFLNERAASSPGLHIYILAWDFPMMYWREREWMPVMNFGWRTHRHVHFRMDDEHPVGASQHQKFVVVDDSVAFCGGIDLTKNRWDTPEHREDDERRAELDGKPYAPFHDLQMVVDGEGAGRLGDLFRQRWMWMTGQELPPVETVSEIRWPDHVSPDLTDVEVAIARTLPAYKGRRGVREVEALYRDAIVSAERFIYIENQYFTSAAIGQALASRLEAEKGPEVVIVLPKVSSGWLEQSTMDVLRCRLIEHLLEKDRYGRLKVYFPAVGRASQPVYVHAKTMVVDDRLAIVGSANLSNRSMGLDSECCLAVEAEEGSEQSQAMGRFRNRLLAEHLGTSAEEVAEVLNAKRSMAAAIESLGRPDRLLMQLDHKVNHSLDATEIISDPELLDPEKPLKFDQIMDQFAGPEAKEAGGAPVSKLILILVVLFAVAAAWRWTPLSEWLTIERMVGWATLFEHHPLYSVAVITAYAVGGVLMVPVTLLIGVTALVFSPFQAALHALAGCLMSASVTYGIGVKLGKRTIRKLAGQKTNALSRHLASQGLLTVALVRNLPIAPFTIVNIVAGATHIRFKDFILGTLLGMLPGVLFITFFTDRVIAAVKDPGWLNVTVAAVVVLVFGLGLWWSKRRLTTVKSKADRSEED